MTTDRSRGRRRAASAPTSTLGGVAEDMRQATLATLNGVIQDAELAGAEAQEARSAGELAALQFEWAAQQWSRSLQAAADMLRGWLEVQTVWWQGVEQAARAGLQPWQVAGPAPAPAPAPPDADAAWPASPAELLARCGEYRDAVVHAWMRALDHDLRQVR